MCIKVDLLYKDGTVENGISLDDLGKVEPQKLLKITFYFTKLDTSEALEAQKCKFVFPAIQNIHHSYNSPDGFATVVTFYSEGRKRSGAVVESGKGNSVPSITTSTTTTSSTTTTTTSTTTCTSTTPGKSKKPNQKAAPMSVTNIYASLLAWIDATDKLSEVNFSWISIESVELHLDSFQKGCTVKLKVKGGREPIAFLKRQTPPDSYLTTFATGIHDLISCGVYNSSTGNGGEIAIKVSECACSSKATDIIKLISDQTIFLGRDAMEQFLREKLKNESMHQYMVKQLGNNSKYFLISRCLGGSPTLKDYIQEEKKYNKLPDLNLFFCLGLVSIPDILSLNNDRIIGGFNDENILFHAKEGDFSFFCIDNAPKSCLYMVLQETLFDCILKIMNFNQDELTKMLSGQVVDTDKEIRNELFYGSVLSGIEWSWGENKPLSSEGKSLFTDDWKHEAYQKFMRGFLNGVLKLLRKLDQLIWLHKEIASEYLSFYAALGGKYEGNDLMMYQDLINQINGCLQARLGKLQALADTGSTTYIANIEAALSSPILKPINHLPRALDGKGKGKEKGKSKRFWG